MRLTRLGCDSIKTEQNAFNPNLLHESASQPLKDESSKSGLISQVCFQLCDWSKNYLNEPIVDVI